MNLIFRTLPDFLDGIGAGTIFADVSSQHDVLLSSLVAIGKRNDVFAVAYLRVGLTDITQDELVSALKEHWKVYAGCVKICMDSEIQVPTTKLADKAAMKTIIDIASKNIKSNDAITVDKSMRGVPKKDIMDNLLKKRDDERARRGRPPFNIPGES